MYQPTKLEEELIKTIRKREACKDRLERFRLLVLILRKIADRVIVQRGLTWSSLVRVKTTEILQDLVVRKHEYPARDMVAMSKALVSVAREYSLVDMHTTMLLPVHAVKRRH